MAIERKPLTGILPGGNGGSDDGFDIFSVEAADEFGPLRKGSYVCIAESGRPSTSRSGTPGYEITFRVIEGDHAGRKVWKTFWLTADAAKYSRRDIQKFGFTSNDQLKEELPRERFVVRLTLTVRKSEDGVEYNEVKTIELIRVQDPEVDPYAPTDDLPTTAPDTSFPFGANAGGES